MAEFNPADHILLVVIVLLWPLYVATYRFPRLKQDIVRERGNARIRAYVEGAALEWILLAVVMIAWFVAGRNAEALGLTAAAGWRLWLGVVCLLVVIVLLSIQRRRVMQDLEAQEQLRETLINVSPLLPASRGELAVFHGLAITAGVCEEILYRGFVMWYITEVTGIVGGVILSSALFGLAHAYQGNRGMVQTGAVGLILAIIYVLSGTLWIPVLLHAFLDINSGLLAYGIRRSSDGGDADAQASDESEREQP